MIYIWLALVIVSSSLFPANAYYKRLAGVDLHPNQNLEQEGVSRKYIERIRPRIRDRWHPINSQKPMRSIYFFTVQPSGHITDIQMERGSGNQYYDKSCKRALMAASPFKKPDEAKRIGMLFESHKTKEMRPLSTVKNITLKPFKAIF